MSRSKLLTLVLSSEEQPFQDIRLLGQRPTWISQAESEGFSVLAYTSKGDANERLRRQVDRVHGLEEVINKTPLSRIRPVRGLPGRLSSQVVLASAEAEVQIDGWGNLDDSLGDGLALIGARTIRAFEYALENFDFEFLARTNTSSYLDVSGLSKQLPESASRGTIYALSGRWGRNPYPSGALYVLSRQDLEELVANQHFWIHEYIDDVALGLLAKRVFGTPTYIPIERFEYPFNAGADDPQASKDFVHYRCKSPQPDVTISRLVKVHEIKQRQS